MTGLVAGLELELGMMSVDFDFCSFNGKFFIFWWRKEGEGESLDL